MHKPSGRESIAVKMMSYEAGRLDGCFRHMNKGRDTHTHTDTDTDTDTDTHTIPISRRSSIIIFCGRHSLHASIFNCNRADLLYMCVCVAACVCACVRVLGLLSL